MKNYAMAGAFVGACIIAAVIFASTMTEPLPETPALTLDNCSVNAIVGNDTTRINGVSVTFTPETIRLYKPLQGGQAEWNLPTDSLTLLSIGYIRRDSL